MVEDAPAAIVLLGNKEYMKYPENWEQDLGATTENLLLQAVELDLGAVWLGVSPLQDRMEHIKSLFSLPNNINPFAVVPVGYPHVQSNTFVDRFDETRIHFEKY